MYLQRATLLLAFIVITCHPMTPETGEQQQQQQEEEDKSKQYDGMAHFATNTFKIL
ncbi:unnamed protein product [Gongylonema pulchrum]|uniref:Secreted protein n=1 Tax=Gongylonema pulchrum TaxID=637853 RepID=A0A183D5H7_9BILA|nr:unnamed protein product [Gongylonema pulchrum]